MTYLQIHPHAHTNPPPTPMNLASYILLALVVLAFVIAARYRARGGGRKSCCDTSRGGEDNSSRKKGCADGETKAGHKKSIGKDGTVRCTGSCCELGLLADRRRLKTKEEYEALEAAEEDE